MRWLPLAALVLVLPASAAAPVPKHLIKDEPFWPTAVGTKWVYEEKAGEQVDELTKVEKKPTGTLLTIRTRTPGGFTGDLLFEERTDAVVWQSVSDLRKNEMLLRFPIKDGDTWEFKHPLNPRLLAQTGHTTVHEEEEVKVPAGTFRAIKVTCVISELNGKPCEEERLTYWYARGTGLIKRAGPESSCMSAVLKSFAPGKK